MRLSEVIRLGSLAIQEPKAGSSESCAIGMAAMSIGEHAIVTFPPDLIEPCIKAGCPEGGTVLELRQS